MGKDNKIVWVIAAVIGTYLLMPEKVKEAVAPGGGGITSINLGDMLSGLKMPEITTALPGVLPDIKIPEFDFPEIPEFDIPTIPENLPQIPSVIPGLPESSDILPGVMPDIVPEITPDMIENVVTASKYGVGVLGRQYTGAALTGVHVVKPLPYASIFDRFGKAFNTILRRVGAKGGAKLGTRIAARGIPFVGWGLLGADVGADIARLFGADVTEWLGFSPIIGAFTGENPLEAAVRKEDKQVAVTESAKETETEKDYGMPERAPSPMTHLLEKPKSEFERIYGSTRI